MLYKEESNVTVSHYSLGTLRACGKS